MYYIVALGNPGEEYEKSRHNAGRIVVDTFVKKQKIEPLEGSKKMKALSGEGKLGKKSYEVIYPETFMNKSWISLKPLITSKKKAKDMVVVHDDVDLPIGHFKICFGRGSAGHKGVESIIKGSKTNEFARIRVGICPIAPSGKMKKKPTGDKFTDFIIKDFNPKELDMLKKASKKIALALETLIEKGASKAMCDFN